MAKTVCININFDSLRWSLNKDPKDFHDPTFFHIADRFFEYSKKYNFKYTIFIIGEDLENPAVAERVKQWSDDGHEIGNHSYSHSPRLGSMNNSELEFEVMKSHEIISKVCGKEPKGFIAPGWSTSASLVKILLKNDYIYDTSVLPSYFMWLMIAKLWWNFRNDDRKNTLLQRRDFFANIFASNKPYFCDGKRLSKKSSDGLLILPLPVTNSVRFPCWHTMSFLVSQKMFNRALTSCLKQHDQFYYLVHPTDLYDRNDIKDVKVDNLERLDTPLEIKRHLMDNSLDRIFKSGAQAETLIEIARDLI